MSLSTSINAPSPSTIQEKDEMARTTNMSTIQKMKWRGVAFIPRHFIFFLYGWRGPPTCTLRTAIFIRWTAFCRVMFCFAAATPRFKAQILSVTLCWACNVFMFYCTFYCTCKSVKNQQHRKKKGWVVILLVVVVTRTIHMQQYRFVEIQQSTWSEPVFFILWSVRESTQRVPPTCTTKTVCTNMYNKDSLPTCTTMTVSRTRTTCSATCSDNRNHTLDNSYVKLRSASCCSESPM